MDDVAQQLQDASNMFLRASHNGADRVAVRFHVVHLLGGKGPSRHPRHLLAHYNKLLAWRSVAREKGFHLVGAELFDGGHQVGLLFQRFA
jgi:hypothetical protein